MGVSPDSFYTLKSRNYTRGGACLHVVYPQERLPVVLVGESAQLRGLLCSPTAAGASGVWSRAMGNSWSHTFQRTSGGLRGIMKRAVKYLQDENSCCRRAAPAPAHRLGHKSLFHLFQGVDKPKIFYFQPLSRTTPFPYNILLECFRVCVYQCESQRIHGKE